MRSIYWIRDDLRLHDNKALLAFAESGECGPCVWTPSASFLRAGAKRRTFILKSLLEFKTQLASLGVELHRLENDLMGFIRQNQIERVYFTKSVTFDEQQEENLLGNQGVGIQQNSLLADADLPFTIQKLPEVFTAYRKLVEGSVIIPATLSPPKVIKQQWHADLNSTLLYQVPALVDGHPQITPGETAGRTRIKEYFWELDRLKSYKETRDGMLDWNDSSKLSPWLSIGALSPREIYRQIKLYEQERGANESTYWLYFELLWRDYFRLIARKKGAKLFTEKVSSDLSLSQRQERFSAWCAGTTGDDFVDANMNELNQTGWMSNRGRQNVASYLAKTLGVPWQWGASYFEEQLIDYDPSSNWGNWAYLAGVGQDTRNRIFNTQLQASRYDTDGDYRRKWNR